MKYNILGFDQKTVISYNKQIQQGNKIIIQKLDVIDLLILQYIADILLRDKFIKIIVDGKIFTNIHYKSILQDLPIIDINKRTLALRLDKLCSFGLIEKHLLKTQGNFTYFRTTDAYMDLLYDKGEKSEKEGYAKKTTYLSQSIDVGMSKKRHTKDSSINPSINSNKKDISNDISKNDDFSEYENYDLVIEEEISEKEKNCAKKEKDKTNSLSDELVQGSIFIPEASDNSLQLLKPSKKHTVYEFEEFWNDYDKKNDLKNCKKKWEKLNEEVKLKIKEHVPLYVKSTQDKQYRKNPLTYLNQEAWNNEIITNQNKNGNYKSKVAESYSDREERIAYYEGLFGK